MRTLVIAAIVAATSAPVMASTTNYVLDFQGEICANPSGAACVTGGQAILQSYGDEPGIDIEWNARDDARLGDVNARPFYIADPLGNPFGTPWTSSIPGSVILKALDGATVGLQGLDLVNGPDGSGSIDFELTITDQANVFAPISQSGSIDNLMSEIFNFSSLSLTSSVGIEILLLSSGSGRFGVGLDNIAYSVTPSGSSPPLAPVPLPATSLLLVGGLAGLATLRRRRGKA